ncbi:MAG TPA: PAS domain S-box protein [Kiritimatiellia bacterium]|nr:PAS domain S-box protein [Kiritimatiellia bacterium]
MPSGTLALNQHTDILNLLPMLGQDPDLETSARELIGHHYTNLVQSLGAYNAWVVMTHCAPGSGTLAVSSFDQGFQPLREQILEGHYPSCMQEALAACDVSVYRAYCKDCHSCPLSTAYEGRAGLACRLEHNRSVYGVLCASIPEHLYADEATRSMFQSIAEDLSAALDALVTTAALRRSERKLTTLFRSAPAGIALVRNRVIQEVNPALAEMTGYPEAELVGKPTAFLFPDRREYRRVGKDLGRLVAKDGQGQTESRFVHKSGRMIDVMLRSVLVNPDQPGLGMVSTALDITDRKAREQQALDNERDLRLLLDQVPHLAIQGYDSTGQTFYWNRASEILYGYSCEEALGQNIVDLLIPAEDQESARRMLDQAGQDGALPPAREMVLRKKNGDRIHVFSGHVGIRQHGHPARFYGIDVDLTEYRHAEAERMRLAVELREAQKYESLGTMAGGIAHDFNNLLTTILGNLELTLAVLDPRDPLAANLKDARTAANRASSLCRQMLAYAGKGGTQQKPVDLGLLLYEYKDTLEKKSGGYARLELDIEGEPLVVRVDPVELRHILSNLVENAAEAYEGKTGRVVISVRRINLDAGQLGKTMALRWANKPGSYIALSVADSGCGIPPNLMPRIFDPFVSTKFLGRGLGLAAVQGIVRHHQGAIRVTSEPGKGTTLTIFLPEYSA